eukprot:scaffold271558_cov19-Tisochrysis_lutea.AAC.1
MTGSADCSASLPPLVCSYALPSPFPHPAFSVAGTAKLPSPGELGLSGRCNKDGIQGSQKHIGLTHTSSTAPQRSAAAGTSQQVWPGEAKGSQAEAIWRGDSSKGNVASAQPRGIGEAGAASVD